MAKLSTVISSSNIFLNGGEVLRTGSAELEEGAQTLYVYAVEDSLFNIYNDPTVVLFARSVVLAHDDGGTGRKGGESSHEYVDQDRGRSADRSQGFFSDELTHDDGVGGVIQKLEKGTEHKGQEKEDHFLPYLSLGYWVYRCIFFFIRNFSHRKHLSTLIPQCRYFKTFYTLSFI